MEKVNTEDGPMYVAGSLWSLGAWFIDLIMIVPLIFSMFNLLDKTAIDALFNWAGWLPGLLAIVYAILARNNKVPSLANWVLALKKYPCTRVEGHPGKGTVHLVEDLDFTERLKRLAVAIFAIGVLFIVFLASISDMQASAINDGYITGADDAELYYKVMGTGQDTIVVVHGGPGAGMHSVIPSFKPLAENFVLIFYDQRGGGRSTLPADTTKLKPEYFVEDLEAVRAHFDLGQMNVITHSFGSVLVAQYAMKYPDHLNRMVFHGATGPDLKQELKIRRAKAKLAPPSPDTALSNRASELLQSLLAGTANDPVETCKEYEEINRKLAVARGDTVTWKGTICDAPSEAVRYYYRYTAQIAPRYYRGWDFTRKMGDVKAPLLVVYGKQDSLMIPAQQAWTNAVPNGKLLLVPGAEKGAFSDNPEFVLSAVTSFLNGE